MSKSTWVCFECRQAVRREDYGPTSVKCSLCANECVNIGRRIPLPRKKDEKGWRSLQEHMKHKDHRLAEKEYRLENDREYRNDQETAKRIQAIQSRPSNPAHRKLIQRLYERWQKFR